MNVFCVVTSISGYEPVTLFDAGQMKSLPDGSGIEAFIRDWGDRNL